MAGTLVKTEDGNVPIEEIEPGDKVYAKDTETGEEGYKEVVRLFVSQKDILVHITIGDEQIDTTSEHPFWVDGEGFVEAQKLSAGDQVLTADGELKTITAVTTEKLEEPVTVYNFEVKDWHTYYVSEEEILVHNECGVVGKKTSISTTESPALNDSPYNPNVVAQRTKPNYVSNPAHDASSRLYNPKKTPEPSDARTVYNNAVRGGMGEWYGVNDSGKIYQFFYDRNSGTHFAGIISKQDLARKNSSVIELLGITMKGKR